MGTQKQADTLLDLYRTYHRREGLPAPTPEVIEKFRAKVLAAPLGDVRAMFATVNGLLGFDRKTSPATVNQLAIVGRLEKALYGERRTTFLTALTYAEASTLIDELNAARAAKAARS